GGRGGGNANYGHIYNEPITPESYTDAYKETRLYYFLTHGDWPDRAGHETDFNVEKEAYFRMFLIQKSRDLHINIGLNEVGLEARSMIRQLNRGEPMNPLDFQKQLLTPNGLTLDDFERTIRHDAEIQALYALQGGSGALVTPQEAKMLYLR